VALSLLKKGKSEREVARILGASHTLVWNWAKEGGNKRGIKKSVSFQTKPKSQF